MANRGANEQLSGLLCVCSDYFNKILIRSPRQFCHQEGVQVKLKIQGNFVHLNAFVLLL